MTVTRVRFSKTLGQNSKGRVGINEGERLHPGRRGKRYQNVNTFGKCRQRKNIVQTQPLVCLPRREAAKMVGRDHLVWKVPTPGRGRWMHSLALVNSVMEQGRRFPPSMEV